MDRRCFSFLLTLLSVLPGGLGTSIYSRSMYRNRHTGTCRGEVQASSSHIETISYNHTYQSCSKCFTIKDISQGTFLVFHIGLFNKIVWHYNNGKGPVHDNILILNAYKVRKIRCIQ